MGILNKVRFCIFLVLCFSCSKKSNSNSNKPVGLFLARNSPTEIALADDDWCSLLNGDSTTISFHPDGTVSVFWQQIYHLDFGQLQATDKENNLCNSGYACDSTNIETISGGWYADGAELPRGVLIGLSSLPSCTDDNSCPPEKVRFFFAPAQPNASGYVNTTVAVLAFIDFSTGKAASLVYFDSIIRGSNAVCNDINNNNPGVPTDNGL